MGEVIDIRTARMSERQKFVYFLAAELDELDFQDFVEAVRDPGYYTNLDDDLKMLVDRFNELAG